MPPLKLSETEELEVCCVCLDSLCAEPVVALLGHGGARAACPHYLHAACAERLRPQRCPLCRTPFAAPSAPIGRPALRALPPAAVLAGLRRLAGLGGAALVPARCAVELFAAILPVRQAALQELLLQEAGGGGLDEAALERLMRQLDAEFGGGLQLAGYVASQWAQPRLGSAARADAGYSLALLLFRRGRRLSLKLTGAAGAAIHLACFGMGVGTLAGVLAALPRLSPRDVFANLPVDEDDDWRAVLLFAAIALVGQLAYQSFKHPVWVKRGCRYGALCGALLGWLHALAAVDPDRHSFGSVFLMGIVGRTTWPGLLRLAGANGGDFRAAPGARVDVFATDACARGPR